MSIKRNEQEILPEELSKALDAWEPSPVSLDFNRRLYQRIEKMDARRKQRRRVVSSIPLALLCCAALLLRTPHPWLKTNAEFQKTLSVNGPEFEQQISDLKMLRQISAEEAR